MRKLLFLLVMVPVLLLAACEDDTHNVYLTAPELASADTCATDTVTVTIKCVKRKHHGRWIEECDTTYSN